MGEIIKGFPSTMGDTYQLNLIEIIKYAATMFPKTEVAYRCLDGKMFRYNYLDAYRRISKMAHALKDLGVRPGDRVGVMEFNSHRFFELYFAISGIGAVLMQLNPRISKDDRIYVINHSGTKLIFVNELLVPLIEEISDSIPNVEKFVVISETDKNKETSLSPVFNYEKLLEGREEEFNWPMINESSAYSGAYTSGTTGKPKGIYYSHRAICLHTMIINMLSELTPNDAMLQIVPMFHANGWGAFFGPPMVGARLVFPGLYSAENPGPLVELLVNEKITVTNGAPAIFLPMLHYIEKMDPKPKFNNLRMLSGATEPPLALMKKYAELGAEVIHAYGASETTPLVTLNKPKPYLSLDEEKRWELKKKQGYFVPFIDWKLKDPLGGDVPTDGKTVGELYLKGPWITCKYYNDERTKDAISEDGYWKSGDAATVDENGYLKITDRFKDLIKSGGEWISSIDLENAIMAHPEVAEASVVGIPHPKWEERPLALVVLKDPSKDIKEKDILDFISPKFAKWQLPDRVLFVDSIPKTSVGKFSKKDIRKMYWDFYTKNA
ncbi:long-chain-fatty-acid--CoA ligase [Desulfothermus sp.]